MSTELAKPANYSQVVQSLAEAYGVAESTLTDLFKKIVFRDVSDVTNNDMLSAMILCNEYKLNPVLKHIHAFKSKDRVQIVIGVDGWARIINDHPQFDGVSFVDTEGAGGLVSCTCTIHRKDRDQPTVVTEYLTECQQNTVPWQKWPRRMLRHKALEQCARIAFGVGGIISDDEEENYREADRIGQTQKTRRRTATVTPIEQFLPPPSESVLDDGEIVTGVRGDLFQGGAE